MDLPASKFDEFYCRFDQIEAKILTILRDQTHNSIATSSTPVTLSLHTINNIDKNPSNMTLSTAQQTPTEPLVIRKSVEVCAVMRTKWLIQRNHLLQRRSR